MKITLDIGNLLLETHFGVCRCANKLCQYLFNTFVKGVRLGSNFLALKNGKLRNFINLQLVFCQYQLKNFQVFIPINFVYLRNF